MTKLFIKAIKYPKILTKHSIFGILFFSNLLYPLAYAQSENQIEKLTPDLKSSEEPGAEDNKNSATDTKLTLSPDNKILQRITVVGNEDKAEKVPGSAYLIKGKELEKSKKGFDDINRVLQNVPGINLQEEEGFGLRPNIGFRGTPSERSDSITLMEDGVLIAPAPYSAPAAYYFPTTGRMEGIEVLKGAGQIKYGPRTIGGSLNLLSTSIPKKFRVKGQIAGGSNSTKKLQLAMGDSYKYAGWSAETYQIDTNGFKDLDGGGNTGFELEDYVGKLRLNTDPEDGGLYQQLEFKVVYNDQDSNETYLGLAERDFEENPYRRYASSQLDNIQVQHNQYQAQHFIEFNDNFDLTTTAYLNKTKRNWYKLDSVSGTSLTDILDDPNSYLDQYALITGTDSPDDALSIRENNRVYDSKGIQTVFVGKVETGNVKHEIEAGARFHFDEEDRFQKDDKYKLASQRLILTTPGTPGTQANRVVSANAWAFYAQDAINFDKLTVTPGLRYENVNFSYKDYGKLDPQRNGIELKRNDSEVSSLIPGVGVHYQFTKEFASFAGVHKGFSPPGPSTSQGVEEEKSVNYEVGANYNRGSFKSEAVLFYTDYQNLLGADTLASGGLGTGDLFNAGEAKVYGLELALQYDIAENLQLPVQLPFLLAYTYTSAEFGSSFDGTFFGDVKKGDKIPYIPQNQVTVALGVENEKWGSLGLTSRYVQAMETASNAPKTDSYVVFDASAETPIVKDVRFFVDVLNILDKEYIVARRPAGARPGLPLTALAGIKFDF